MASYGGEDLGAFLPGLTRIVKTPFKTAAKVTKTFFKSPIKAVGQLALAPWEMAKSVKFAVAGSKPIFGRKRTAAAKPSTIVTASTAPQSRATSIAEYLPQASVSSVADMGVPMISIPEPSAPPAPVGPQQVPVSESAASPAGKMNMMIPLLVVAGVGAALFFGSKKRR